ncbi:MAG: Rpn family recombination-promoting nuclease/putative transposase [Erysipelotrichales bacterium]|nr:Rpn family recombination-promoting nuclease/putative transposase [Erysipelotrichales bacterium]
MQVSELELNLSNDFLFKHCMSDVEVLQPVLEELWERKIPMLKEVQINNHIQPTMDHKSVYCDVYVRDIEGNIYIIEMQQSHHAGLLERSEFYQGISIYNECAMGKSIEYKDHSRCYIVFLCCFDVSKIYPHIKFPLLEYIPKTIYKDESKMLVNLKNYERVGNKRLQELFKFILRSDLSLHASWYVIELLQGKLGRLKGDKKRMKAFEFTPTMIDDYRDEGRQVGRMEGRSEGVDSTNESVVSRMIEQKFPIETISKITALSYEKIQEIIDRLQLA